MKGQEFALSAVAMIAQAPVHLHAAVLTQLLLHVEPNLLVSTQLVTDTAGSQFMTITHKHSKCLDILRMPTFFDCCRLSRHLQTRAEKITLKLDTHSVTATVGQSAARLG